MNPFEFLVHGVIYFTIFAVAGYIIEAFGAVFNIFARGKKRKISNRGFLFGPYLPIYGFAGLIMMWLLNYIPRDNLILTFFAAMAMGVTLEYSTSYVLEKIFHLRWWDYSESDKIQLNGRICLRNALKFGAGGILFMYLVMPALGNLTNALPWALQVAFALIMLVIYAIDVIASSYANAKVGSMEDFGKVIGDQTEEIKKNARKAIRELFATPEKIARKVEKASKKAAKRIEKARQKAR